MLEFKAIENLKPVNGKIKCRKSVNLNVGFPTSFLMI